MSSSGIIPELSTRPGVDSLRGRAAKIVHLSSIRNYLYTVPIGFSDTIGRSSISVSDNLGCVRKIGRFETYLG